MGLGVVTSFSTPVLGICLYCERSRLVIPLAEGGSGICDVCSYALRGAWQEAQGERLLVTSPRLVKTYLLVPRLKKERSLLDVSSYEILLDERGGLPSLDYARADSDLAAWLRSSHQVVTWEGDTTRRCYLGYDGRADFSEVILVWAWGKVPRRGGRRRQSFGTFADLFHEPSADAGFYLGVKAAFESLLWRVEATEGNRLCVVLREAAMHYLGCKLPGALGDGDDGDDDGDEEDPSMVEVYHAAASPEELGVVSLLQGAARRRREEEEASAALAGESTRDAVSVREPSAREPSAREPSAR